MIHCDPAVLIAYANHMKKKTERKCSSCSNVGEIHYLSLSYDVYATGMDEK